MQEDVNWHKLQIAHVYVGTSLGLRITNKNTCDANKYAFVIFENVANIRSNTDPASLPWMRFKNQAALIKPRPAPSDARCRTPGINHGVWTW